MTGTSKSSKASGVVKLPFCERIIIWMSYVLNCITFPLSLLWTTSVVREYERAVIFRLGRVMEGEAKGPGIFFMMPCTDDFRCVDLRTKIFDVPPQEILTSDSLTVAVDAVVYWRVFDPVLSLLDIVDVGLSTQLLAKSILRNTLGLCSLHDLLGDQGAIKSVVLKMLDEATDQWGVKVELVEIKNIRLPQQMQRSMAQEAEATREARAKIISADGERRAALALCQASDTLATAHGSMQLRYMQTLNIVAADRNQTIAFPVPTGLWKHFS